MESCLLCLEINKDLLDSIKASSTRWGEQNIAKVIEKHFWPMNIIQHSSWICLSCWQVLDDFHKFFMRVEEAHMNFGKIKVEDCAAVVECKEELILQKTKIKDNNEEPDEDNLAFCFLSEMLIDQPQPEDLMVVDKDMVVDKETTKTEPLDEIDLDDMPLKQAGKRLRLQNEQSNKDPLEKFKKPKINKPRNRKTFKAKASAEIKPTEENTTEESKIKPEPIDLNDNNDSDSVIDNNNDAADVTYQPDKDSSETVESKRRKAYSKHRTNRKENDQFIAEHFKQMFCDLCQAPFEDFPAMKNHFRINHNQRGYVVCCKRKFLDRTLLVDHLHCHLNPNHFKCNECGKAMSDRISFDSHMLRVHRASEVVKQHCCDVCGKSFTKACLLRIHKLTHLPEEEKKFPCSDCGKNYGSPYLLNQHRQAVHLKRFAKICYICGKSINSSAEFKVHMNKHEGIPASVIHCDVCGLRLTSERGLKLHKESQHPIGGKQEHHCPICPKISPTLTALKKHINTMHGKGYDHKCSICEKAFKRSEALKEHMASHTGTTLYTCPWCPKTFNSNGNMHAHRKKIHPKEWEESKLQKYSDNIQDVFLLHCNDVCDQF